MRDADDMTRERWEEMTYAERLAWLRSRIRWPEGEELERLKARAAELGLM